MLLWTQPPAHVSQCNDRRWLEIVNRTKSVVDHFAPDAALRIGISLSGETAVASTAQGAETFPIGSITKTLSAAIALRMLSSKELAGKVSAIVPLWPHGAEITILDLLSNRSGYRELWSSGADVIDDRLARRITQEPLLFPPGSAHNYTSTDYMVLGGILEKIGGKPFGSILNEFLDEIGLSESHALTLPYSIPSSDLHGLSESNVRIVSSAFLAAGGAVSSVTDILRFDHWLFDLRPELLSEMKRFPGSFGDGESGIPGWYVSQLSEGPHEYWHDGMFPGFSVVNITIPERRVFVVVEVVGIGNPFLIGDSIASFASNDRCDL